MIALEAHQFWLLIALASVCGGALATYVYHIVHGWRNAWLCKRNEELQACLRSQNTLLEGKDVIIAGLQEKLTSKAKTHRRPDPADWWRHCDE